MSKKTAPSQPVDLSLCPANEEGKLVFYRDNTADLDAARKKEQRDRERAARKSRSALPRMRGRIPLWILSLANLVLLGSFLCLFALFHHVLPQKMGFKGIQTYGEPGNWSETWAEHFTADGSVEITDNSYRSGDISVTMSTITEGDVTYCVADIYIASIYNLKTAFASDTYGKGFTQTVLTMAKNNNAIVATNGDYYGFREQGIVIRNGMVYRSEPWEDVCVIYYNGIMETYAADEFDLQTAIDGGAWQAWGFGPALLDKEGKAITQYVSTIDGLHPRCGIGYYEPGHYCMVLIDGRQSGYSIGMDFADMAKLFEGLGCKAAYNLDGGKSAVMTYMDKVYDRPYEGGRKISDIVYIGEVE